MLQCTKTARDARKKLLKQSVKGGHWDWSLRANLTDKDFIEIDQLYLDEDTQRDFCTPSRVTKLMKIVANPDTRRIKRITVARRAYANDNRHFIIDGMGRTLAAHVSGQTRIPYDEVVFNSIQDEVKYFLEQGKDTHAITGWEKHAVVLSTPDAKTHTRSLDIERVVSQAKIAYKAQKIRNYDCSKAFSGIRDSIVDSDKASAGSRKGLLTIGIIDIMKKHADKDSNGMLIFRSDLFYPFTNFCLGYSKPLRSGLKKLEERIISLKKTNGGTLTLDDMAQGMSLGVAKNMNDKKKCSKRIKGW
tara:strand:+ start:645 stop:1553 length:909 start_codon:yes stop_codon:yes gene_type:complete